MATESKQTHGAGEVPSLGDVPQHPTSFGAFKPEGHVLLGFAKAADSDAAFAALLDEGMDAADIRRYSDREMLQQVEADLARVSPLADFGQEINLLRFHREAALAGYHWLLVRAGDEAHATQIARRAQALGAALAQYYGKLLIVELIRHQNDLPQRTESPARGLDPGMPRDSTEPP